MREDPRVAVAVTGSAARGDASAGSDLDLWCVSPRYGGHVRLHRRAGAIPVTLLCDSPRSAGSVRSLARTEVEELVVLRDPGGVFPVLQRAARARRPELWAGICRATSQGLEAELLEGTRGPVWSRVPPLREAALRCAAAWVCERQGWRTPRWRTLRRVLPRDARAELGALLGLPPASEARRSVLQLGRALGTARLGTLPVEVRARLRAGEHHEALLLARRHVEREVLPGLQAVHPALRRALRRAHGLQAVADGDFRPVARAAVRLRRLVELLEVARLFSPRVREQLAAL